MDLDKSMGGSDINFTDFTWIRILYIIKSNSHLKITNEHKYQLDLNTDNEYLRAVFYWQSLQNRATTDTF